MLALLVSCVLKYSNTVQSYELMNYVIVYYGEICVFAPIICILYVSMVISFYPATKAFHSAYQSRIYAIQPVPLRQLQALARIGRS